MLADEGLVAARQAERGLELAARAQHAGQIRAPDFGQHHRAGHIAACPAVEKGRRGGFFPVGGQGTHTGHAVVHAHQDVTVVQQPGIGQMRQTAQGLAVAQADGLAAGIGRGHDQHGRGLSGRSGQADKLVEKDGMQGRVRQHEADAGGIRRDIGGQAALAGRAEHDGLFRAKQQGLVLRGKVAQLPCRGQIRHHQGQRLVRAPLAQAQQGHAAGGAGVTGQLEAPQALDGQQVALPQQGGRPCHGIPHGCFRRQGLRAGPVCRGAVRGQGAAGREQRVVHQPQARPALRAGHGLGMETAVQRVAVFGLAAGAEGEAGHAGGGAVVGDGPGDGVARPAVGAIGEGIAEARIAGRVHVAQAVLADAHIGADQHAVAGMAVAGHDDEFRLAVHGGQLRDLQPGEPGQGRQLPAQTHGKGCLLYTSDAADE